MRTSLEDLEDKQLVQIELQFERQDLRITWTYVAQRMSKTKRSAQQLRLRLEALKHTYRRSLRAYPRWSCSVAHSR
ncbi:hypothetical protein GQ600_4990 [Phytophthora cactorum]|nr:hypothetical protein GQ600_4990 [Phytophthora cactorum]